MTPPIDHLDVSDSETVRRHAPTFRKARLARLAAVEAKRDAPSDDLPPRVPARDASSDEVPRGAKSIAKHARAHGWRVREVYAEGPPMNRDEPSDGEFETPSRISESGAATVSVRCWVTSPPMNIAELVASDEPSDEHRWAVALYRSGKLDACLWADEARGLRRVKTAELRALLAGLAVSVPVR